MRTKCFLGKSQSCAKHVLVRGFVAIFSLLLLWTDWPYVGKPTFEIRICVKRNRLRVAKSNKVLFSV